VISSVDITGLRGIRQGKLADLTPLAVLVGPNGAGKSTILEALLIGASPVPGDAVGRSVRRHPGIDNGARWLIGRFAEAGAATIAVTTDGGSTRRCELTLEPTPPRDTVAVRYTVVNGAKKLSVVTRFPIRKGNAYDHDRLYHPLADVGEVRLVEPHAATHLQPPLYQLYTSTVEQGRRRQAKEIIADVVPHLTDVEILTEDDVPIVHLVFEDFSVPAALAGDGIQSLVRLSLELASRRGGVVLVEEPEVHQHPRSLRQSAKAILAAVRRGVQVVLTTHSLELIDALLSAATGEGLSDLDKFSVYGLALRDGQLISTRYSGTEVEAARGQIQDDLR
jgi:energy-coupling factor transporter ATP-binding protein EcfA2